MQTQPARPAGPQPGPASEESAAETRADTRNPARADDPAAPLPFAALEHVFVFTTGDRQSVWESPLTDLKFKHWIGQDLNAVRQAVPRDVVCNCDPVGLLGPDGNLSGSLWQWIAARRPELAEKQRRGACCLSVHTFRLESGAVVALALFYDSQKLEREPR
jgi:hypothetical protein